MDRLHFDFDYQKSTQALNYFAIQEGGQINKMKALKLVYFADRYHLRKYGRLVTNDNYVAMQYGPVPSAVKDMAESNDYLDDRIKRYVLQFIEPVTNRELKSVAGLDAETLSDSDIEALKYAWDNFGDKDQFKLADLTHCYPEWLKFEEDLKHGGTCLQMDIADFLKDPAVEVDNCFNLSDDEKAIIKEQLSELSHIVSLWR